MRGSALLVVGVAAVMFFAGCSSTSGEADGFEKFPSLDGTIDVLYSALLRQDDAGRVVSCQRVLEEFTCIEVFEIEGIDLRDYRRMRQIGQKLWLRGARLRGVLETPVLTVRSVIVSDDVTTIVDTGSSRGFECNLDAPIVPDGSLEVIDGVRLESRWFINPSVVDYYASADGGVILHAPVVTRDMARAVCTDQDRRVQMYESNDLKVCQPEVACEFVDGE